MKTTQEKPKAKTALARTTKNQRVADTATAPPKRTSGARFGANTTLGPSQVPENASLPVSEPVIPGRGRSPK